MKYIIHGDDLVSSRKYLEILRNKYQESITLEGEKLSLENFSESALNPSLFLKKTVIIVENYSGSEKIFEASTLHDVVFWWAKTVTKTPKADKIVYFKNQQVYGIFKFADTVGLKQEKTSLLLLNRLFEERVSSERIISILTRQFKLITQVLDGSIDKVSKSEFVQKKIESQAKDWNLKKIHEALTLLFLTDIKIKKGESKPISALTFLTHQLCA